MLLWSNPFYLLLSNYQKMKTLIVLYRQFIPFSHSHFPSILNLIFCVFFVWSSLNESWTSLRIGKKWLCLPCPTTIGLVWFLKLEKWDKWVFEIWGLINWWSLHMFFLTENVLSIFLLNVCAGYFILLNISFWSSSALMTSFWTFFYEMCYVHNIFTTNHRLLLLLVQI